MSKVTAIENAIIQLGAGETRDVLDVFNIAARGLYALLVFYLKFQVLIFDITHL